MLTLFTERMNGTHYVCLDPDVLHGLFVFIERERALSITVQKAEAEEAEQGSRS